MTPDVDLVLVALVREVSGEDETGISVWADVGRVDSVFSRLQQSPDLDRAERGTSERDSQLGDDGLGLSAYGTVVAAHRFVGEFATHDDTAVHRAQPEHMVD